ncbi:MAG: ATP-binding cassette domain-containing protein, partial [Actinobacteria bacterium]|nr:ATP-binding cassette domain-containing protein [Actinomycetota bacterium]
MSGLTVRYGARAALDDVTLDVPAGAVTAVIGGDGAGKTTLLRALAGVARPTAGTVRSPARRHIGYVAGASGLYDDLSVAENVARQKLAFALAMLHQPELLILDEPTTGVDPVSRVELWRLIAGAAAGGAGVVVSTTYLDEAERAASVLLLDAGRAVAAGPPEAVAAALPPAVPGAREACPGSCAPADDAAPLPQASARGVACRFGRLTAVTDVDLEVRAGEVV